MSSSQAYFDPSIVSPMRSRLSGGRRRQTLGSTMTRCASRKIPDAKTEDPEHY